MEKDKLNEKKPYRNAIRNKNAIVNAFRTLFYRDYDVDNITIKDLIELADVSKSTFYAHFQDIDEVFKEFEEETFEVIDKAIDEYVKAHKKESLPFINGILSYMKKNEEIYGAMLSSRFEGQFVERLQLLLSLRLQNDPAFLEVWGNNKYQDAQITFLANGIVKVIGDVFQKKIKMTMGELASFLDSMIKGVLHK